MKNEDLIDVADSYKSFDTMFELLKVGDYSFLNRECGTMNYPEIYTHVSNQLLNKVNLPI